MLLLVSCSSSDGRVIAAGEDFGTAPLGEAAGCANPSGFPGGAVPGPVDHAELLSAELARRGIDPAKETSAAPAGDANRVFDLRARLVEPEPGNPDQQASVELTWTEQLIADYDQNGVVNAADLTPLGQYFGERVAYDDPDQHDGFAFWPSGDPRGDGELNWRLARIDGNRNGLIELGDITTIAQHWGERLDGYRIYRDGPGVGGFEPVMNHSDPGQVFILPRIAFAPQSGAGQPVCYSWTLALPDAGSSEYFVEPWSIQDEAAGPASDPVDVYLNHPPVASFGWRIAQSGDPCTVEFAADGSYDPDGGIAALEWDFDGDGLYELDADNDSTVLHTFPGYGSYAVGLRVTDNHGAVAVTEADVFIDHHITAAFNISPPVVKVGDSVLFQPADSLPSLGHLNYFWDFQSDGAVDVVSTEYAMQEYIFTEPGEYLATLKIIDGVGRQATATRTVTVVDKLHVELTALIVKGLAPFETTFVVETYLAQDGVTFDWDFDGDGYFDVTSTPEATVTYEYAELGIYNAKVRATDGRGNIAEDMVQVKAGALPTAVITSRSEYYWVDQSITFYSWDCVDPDGTIVEHWWDMTGDGVWEMKEYKASPNHEYGPGDHTVYLKAVDDDGYESHVASFDFHVDERTQMEFSATETGAGNGVQVDFDISATVDDSINIERMWFHCGDGETIEFGQASTGTGSYTYPRGSYVYYACVEDSSGTLLVSETNRIDPGGGKQIPDGLPVLVIRNDEHVYDTNYDAIIYDLNEIGRNFDEVDYYPGVSGDYTNQDHSPVIWYRGGPGAWFEPQEYTRQWTTDEIDDYLAFPRSGNRLLLMSQSHGINNDGYGNPCTGWEEWFGWEILPGSIPDGDPRHPWAPGTTLEPGCAASGLYGFLKMSPRNLKVTNELNGRYRRDNFGYYGDAAERYYGEGSSGNIPGDLDLGLCTQVCGMGFQDALQAGRYAGAFTPGVSTDPCFEGTWDMAFLSWGCRWNAPYENTGYWPPPYSFKPGTGSLWIVGYPWASTSVEWAIPDDNMTRADMLHNILGWLERDPD